MLIMICCPCPISALSDCCIKDCALSHISISMELTEQVCPGYLHSPCEGPWHPGVSLNTVVVISGSCSRAGMWEVIQLGDWRHSAIQLSSTQNTPKDIMEICNALTRPKLDNEASAG